MVKVITRTPFLPLDFPTFAPLALTPHILFDILQ